MKGGNISSDNDIIVSSSESIDLSDSGTNSIGDVKIDLFAYDSNMWSTTMTSDSISIVPTTVNYVDDGSCTITLNSDDYTSPTKTEFKEMIDRLEKLEKMIVEEAELREKHPAVKQAYDEYRLLATLAKIHSNPVDN